MKPLLILLAGPSGVGKTTLQERLEKDIPNSSPSVSDTTRDSRPGEIDGVHYNFVKIGDFREGIKEGRYFEYAEVHGDFYGTPKGPVVDNLRENRDVLFVVDVQGAFQIRDVTNGDSFLRDKYVDFFIMPPEPWEEVLRERLRKRGDSLSVIEKRLRNAVAEVERRDEFYKIIVNDSLDRVYGELCAEIEKFRGSE